MLSLSLTVLEKNDASSLVFTDATGTTGNGGWASNGNIDVTDVTTMTIQLTLKTIDSTVIYNEIDLLSEFGPFTTVDDLVFDITPDMLVDQNNDPASEITDGIYDVVYIVDLGLGTEATYSMTMFAYSSIRNNVYDRLRQLPQIYNSTDARSKEIDDTLLMYSFIKSMEASAYVALEEDLKNILDATEKIYVNGSNYTWK